MENPSITWYPLKKHRNRKFRFYIIFVSDLGCILASFLGPLAMIFDICSSLMFGCFFGRFVSWRSAPKWSPNGSPNGQKISKTNRNFCSPVQFGRTRLQFGSVLAPLWSIVWSPFGTFWASLGNYLGSLLDMFGLSRASFGHHLRTDCHVAKLAPTD